MKSALASSLIAAMLWGLLGQENDSDTPPQKSFTYNVIDFEYFGSFKGNFEQGIPIESLEGGFAMKLLAEDEAENIRVEGTTASFIWPEESTGAPSRIIMEGNVRIDHPKATITAGKADWDFDTGAIEFTLNPLINMGDLVEDLKVERCVLNLDTGEILTWGGTGGRLYLGGIAGAGNDADDPSLLRTEDILDWPAFIDAVKAQAKAEAPSPGKRVFALLSEGAQKGLAGLATDILSQEENLDDILAEINDVLKNPDMYTADAWAGVALTDEAKQLLAMDPSTRSAIHTTRMNRIMLGAAFPNIIAPLEE